VILVLTMAGLAAAVFPAPVLADDHYDRVQVVEPYLELHTGPGRGYPITQVIERGEWVEILKRRTDWFKIRASDDKIGWVSLTQMEQTLLETGAQLTLLETKLEEYQQRRFEAGFAGGEFNNDPFMLVRAGYRLNEFFSVELTLGQTIGADSTSTMLYASLLSEPFPEWRFSPFFSLGIGQFRNIPKATLVGGVETDSSMANAGLGFNYYLTRRFVLRGDYIRNVVFVDADRINEYNALTLGFSVFFH